MLHSRLEHQSIQSNSIRRIHNLIHLNIKTQNVQLRLFMTLLISVIIQYITIQKFGVSTIF